MSGTDFSVLGPQMQARVARDPADADALLDLATTLYLTMNPENVPAARDCQARALALKRLYRLPAARSPAALRLLALMAPGDMTANSPLDCLLEDSDVELQLLYLSPELPPPASLPEHDVAIVAVGVSEQAAPLLRQAAPLLAASGRPVLNRPEHVGALARDRVARSLAAVPGLAVPVTAHVSRADLERLGADPWRLGALLRDGGFPIIARPVESQGGRSLARLDAPEAVAGYLASVAEDEFFIAPFFDYRGADGQFRKMRVALIDARPYACHLAISSRWMVHYANADMDRSADKRAEEERWMDGFEDGFAHRHAEALRAIARITGLEYVAIDCAELPDGRLLVFEVDTAMIVHAMDPADLYPYKQRHMQKVFAAFRALLAETAAGG